MQVREKQRLIDLAEACQQAASQCESNALLAGTWVQESFEGLAQRLLELAQDGMAEP